MESIEQEEISIGKNGDPALPAEVNSPMVSVAFSSMFTLVTTFFAGTLINNSEKGNYFIAKCNCDQMSIDMTILLLIISTFGFLYATLVYANINGLLIMHQKHKALISATLGNILSEYFGVYFVILSIPLIIKVTSGNLFLVIATLVCDILGLTIYHISGFSLMSRHFKDVEHILYFTGILFFEFILIIEMYFVRSYTPFDTGFIIFSLSICALITFFILISLRAYFYNDKKRFA